METLQGIQKYYEGVVQYIRANEDPRVANWFFMDSHSRVILISLAYLVICKYVGPQLMKDRKPFSLKTTILVYNIIQILLCTWFSYVIISDDTWVLLKLVCDPVKFNPYRVIEVGYWVIFIKMMELLETVFFILRKKQSQVTNLHLYHHATTFLFVWFGIKYKAGLGLSTFGLFNSLVHIIMYTYYMLTASGSEETQKLLKNYKKYITILQMAQFTVILALIARYYVSDCEIPTVLAALFFPNVIFVFYMFYQFYQEITSVKSKIT